MLEYLLRVGMCVKVKMQKRNRRKCADSRNVRDSVLVWCRFWSLMVAVLARVMVDAH
jgi:hypothetical protein